MATTITVRTDTSQATREINKLAQDVGTVGKAAADSSRDAAQSLQGMEDAAADVAAEARRAAQAVDEIADAGTLQGIDGMADNLKEVSTSLNEVTSSARNAASQTAAVSGQKANFAEAAKAGAEAARTFAQNVGEKGVAGAASAALPQITAMTMALGGPWVAAITVAATVVSDLIVAIHAASLAVEDYSEQYDAMIKRQSGLSQSNRDRLTQEQDLRNATLEQLQTQDKALRDELEVQNEVLRLSKERFAQKEREHEQAKGTEDEINAYNEMAAAASDLNEQTRTQKRLREELLKVRQQELITGKREEEDAAKAQAAKQEEQDSIAGQRELAAAQREAELRQNQIDDEIRRKVKLEADERAKREKEQAEYIASLRKAHQDHIDGLSKQFQSPETGNIAQKMIDSISPDQIAKSVAQQRMAKREQELRSQFTSDQASRNQQFFGQDQASIDMDAMQRFEEEQKRSEAKFRQQLQREMRQIQRQARRDTTQGNLNPEEFQAAQQQSVDAILKNAQQSGALDKDIVEALHKSTEELTKQSAEKEMLQQRVADIENSLNKTSQQGNRRRSQMGGGRG